MIAEEKVQEREQHQTTREKEALFYCLSFFLSRQGVPNSQCEEDIDLPLFLGTLLGRKNDSLFFCDFLVNIDRHSRKKGPPNKLSSSLCCTRQ